MSAPFTYTAGGRATGHSVDPEDLHHSTWRHWLGSAADELQLLRDQCRQVFVLGLSMGALTALNLARLFPVDGVVAMSTPLTYRGDWRLNYVDLIAPFMPYQNKKPIDPAKAALRAPDHYIDPVWPVRAVKQFMDYARETFDNLPAVRTPLLAAHSRKDDFILPENLEILAHRAGSPCKEILWLEESDHIITEGPKRQMLFERIQAFISAEAGQAQAAGIVWVSTATSNC